MNRTLQSNQFWREESLELPARALTIDSLACNKDEFELNISDTNMSGEAAIKFFDISTSRPYYSSCKCKLDLSENHLGVNGLSAIFKIFLIKSSQISRGCYSYHFMYVYSVSCMCVCLF